MAERTKRRGRAASLFLTTPLIATFLAAPASVDAGTFPGTNGKIAFATGHIELINSDGSGRVALDAASPASSVNEPAWNAAGTKLVFRDSGHSFSTMNANGSNEKPLVGMPSFAGNPTWSANGSVVAFDSFIGGPQGESRIYTVPAAGGSATELVALDAADPTYSPDGTKIAYEDRAGKSDIGVMNADGSGAANITTGGSGNAGDYDPSWSPDGTKIAFKRAHQIWTMNADGSGATQLTTGTDDSYPTWSPDGAKIAFQRDGDIWVMASDGSDVTNITNTPEVDERDPDWGVCSGSGCPPQVNAPADRNVPEPIEDLLRVALQVTLTRPAAQPVTVQWEYRDGTATKAGGDYEAPITSGTITIPAGQTVSGDLPYSFVRADGITEPDEFYTVELSSPTNASLADARSTITILGVPPKCPGYEDVPGTHIVGTEGDDVLADTDSADVICGLGGNDTIRGADGSDVLDGGPGDDVLRTGGDLYGGGEADSGDDSLYGGEGADSLIGRGTLYGDGGNDTLTGRLGADRLYGGGGNDELLASAGHVTVEGCGIYQSTEVFFSSGDELSGGTGVDTASYAMGFGESRFVHVSLNDVADDGLVPGVTCESDIQGTPDNVHRDVERVIGSRGSDRLIGSRNANRLVGGRGYDTLLGGKGRLADDLDGGPGNDTLEGGGGNDSLSGGDGEDTLRGEDGNDALNGGPDRDTCIGGGGKNTFVACERHRRLRG